MTLYHKLPGIVIIMFFLFVDFSYGNGLKSTKFKQGIAKLNSTTLESVSIKIVVRTTKYSSTTNPYSNGGWWGTELLQPQLIVTDINIMLGKEKIFIPLSAYTDLANPREVLLKANKKDFRVIILGGEAATSYQAELIFENLYIRKRKVFHREFPDVAWEKTVYSFNVNDK